nr:receptor kinase-like protein Xa21 [Ipomoea trifida]
MENPFPNCVVAVLFLAYRIYFSGAVPNLESDKFALLQFKTLITSDPQNILPKNWSSGSPTCQWTGVVCNGKPRVAAVHLSGLGLSGIISPSLGNLTFLTSLDISGNHFTGQIPGALSKLRRLKELNFGTNNLVGEVPFWLGSLPHLKKLFLNNNNFSGTIPPSLCNISTMEQLDMGYNMLRGNIPRGIGNLSELESLYLDSNMLTGSLPDRIFNVSSLRIVNLRGNGLSGRLPSDMCNNHATNLQELYLYENELDGQIPSSICKCKEIELLALYSNKFNGSIPREIGRLTMLHSLYLSENNFRGALPAEIGNLTQLKTLGLASISLTGQIPSFLFNISSLKQLDLNNNSLSGNLPVDLSYNLHGLEELYIGNNQLVGPISTKIYGFTNLQKLEVSKNQLTGSLPREFGNLTFLKFLDIHTNNLTGPPRIASKPGIWDTKGSQVRPPSLAKGSIGRRASIKGNHIFVGVFAIQWAMTVFNELVARIKSLVPPNQANLIIGVPRQVCSHTTIATLFPLEPNVAPTNLPRFAKYTRTEVGVNLPSARRLSQLGGEDASQSHWENEADRQARAKSTFDHLEAGLRSQTPGAKSYGSAKEADPKVITQVKGSQPHQKIHLISRSRVSIQRLTLSWKAKPVNCQARAEGLNSVQMAKPTLRSNRGGLPAELGRLKLEVIGLNGNSLSGFIPFEIFNISTLKSIDLTFNHFSGHLPSSFGLWLPKLEELYLGDNQLKGFIPSSISNASKLSTISITSNNFTGSLPNLSNLRQLRRLLAAGNNITGNLEFLSSLANCRYLELIEVSLNQFNGVLPNSLGNLSTSLKHFRAFGCGIKGVIPTSIGNLTGLTEISLDSNELTGFIPTTLGKLGHLEQLYLEYNRLQGHIPTDLCKLSIRCIECNSIMEVVDNNMIREGDEYFAIKAECVLSICGLAMACLRDSPQQRINTREIVGTLQQLRTSYLAKVRRLPEKSGNLPMLRSFTKRKSP